MQEHCSGNCPIYMEAKKYLIEPISYCQVTVRSTQSNPVFHSISHAIRAIEDAGFPWAKVIYRCEKRYCLSRSQAEHAVKGLKEFLAIALFKAKDVGMTHWLVELAWESMTALQNDWQAFQISIANHAAFGVGFWIDRVCVKPWAPVEWRLAFVFDEAHAMYFPDSKVWRHCKVQQAA